MLKMLFILTCSLLQIVSLFGQFQVLQMKDDKKQVEIPFSFVNNFIIIDVVFNKMLPLKFIFDTGAEYSILNKREVAEAMRIPYEKEFRVLGSDMSTELVAYLIRNNHIDMYDMVAPSADMLVLEDDYFRFEEFCGMQIHGILGANFFKHYVVFIDYDRNILTFRHPNHFDATSHTKGYQQLPVRTYKNKFYIHTHVQVDPDTILQLSLLMDTGASITTLLHTHTHAKLKPPDNTIEGNIAMGLGGYLKGFLGRIHRLELGTFSFSNIITSFQEITSQQDTSQLFGRNGIIGNVLLSRFDIILDYPRARMYLKPKKNYNKGFKFDRSGLGIIASGPNLNRYEISHVITNSPAAEAGLQEGDVITRLNFFNSSFYSLSDIIRILQKREGKKIKMVVRRNGEKLTFRFQLRNLI